MEDGANARDANRGQCRLCTCCISIPDPNTEAARDRSFQHRHLVCPRWRKCHSRAPLDIVWNSLPTTHAQKEAREVSLRGVKSMATGLQMSSEAKSGHKKRGRKNQEPCWTWFKPVCTRNRSINILLDVFEDSSTVFMFSVTSLFHSLVADPSPYLRFYRFFSLFSLAFISIWNSSLSYLFS